MESLTPLSSAGGLGLRHLRLPWWRRWAERQFRGGRYPLGVHSQRIQPVQAARGSSRLPYGAWQIVPVFLAVDDFSHRAAEVLFKTAWARQNRVMNDERGLSCRTDPRRVPSPS